MQKDTIYKVTVGYKDPDKRDEAILCETFGPMEGSTMIAFYKIGNSDNMPDKMINEDCIETLDIVRIPKK